MLVMPMTLAMAGCLLTGDPPGETEDQNHDVTWSFRTELGTRWYWGSTRVRENDSTPEPLDLRSDLGFDSSFTVHLELERDSPSVRFILEADLFSPSGSGMLDHDFAYDEGNFAGNVPFDVSSRFLFARATWALKDVFWHDDLGFVAPVIGLEYPNFSLQIDQSPIADASESNHQFMPYPIVGLAAARTLTPWLDIQGRVVGSYISDWPTIFEEGGRMYMSARTVTAELLLSARLSDLVHINVGAQYQYWDGELHSHEDDNRLTLSSPSVFVGIELRF
jgi:hypothetical protein